MLNSRWSSIASSQSRLGSIQPFRTQADQDIFANLLLQSAHHKSSWCKPNQTHTNPRLFWRQGAVAWVKLQSDQVATSTQLLIRFTWDTCTDCVILRMYSELCWNYSELSFNLTVVISFASVWRIIFLTWAYWCISNLRGVDYLCILSQNQRPNIPQPDLTKEKQVRIQSRIFLT